MSGLIERLHAEAREFNFFRAVQLLEEHFGSKDGGADAIDSGRIRFTPDSSIAFPSSDITAIDEHDGAVWFTLSFMGLVGVSSPLPVYFSEYVTSHPEAAAPLYDFLTIFNHRLYALFYRAWKKYNFSFNFTDDVSDPFTQKIALLSGVGPGHGAGGARMLAYCGMLAGAPRSANALGALLGDYFGGVQVTVTEFVPRWAPLKNIAPLGGAASLGVSTILGTSYFDRAGKFRVTVGPLSRQVYEKFLPGGKNIAGLREIVSGYIGDPLEFEIEVQLQSMELIPVVLGEDGARLGETSALGSSCAMTDIQSLFIR